MAAFSCLLEFLVCRVILDTMDYHSVAQTPWATPLIYPQSALLLAMMLIGLPIAVTMAAVGIVGGMAAYGMPFMDSIAPVVWGVQNDNLLTSIPLFVLMGEILLRSGTADRTYAALAAWLGWLPEQTRGY